MWVMRTFFTRRPSAPPGRPSGVAYGPLQGVVGDLFPAVLGGEKMCSALVLLELGDRVRLVVLGVGPLDARRHEVILAARNEQQWRSAVVLVVDPRGLVAGLEVGEQDAPQNRPRCWDCVAVVQRSGVLLAERVRERVLPLLVRKADGAMSVGRVPEDRKQRLDL